MYFCLHEAFARFHITPCLFGYHFGCKRAVVLLYGKDNRLVFADCNPIKRMLHMCKGKRKKFIWKLLQK